MTKQFTYNKYFVVQLACVYVCVGGWGDLVYLNTVKALNFAWDLFREWTVSTKLKYRTNILIMHCNNGTNSKSMKLNSNELTFMGKTAKYNTCET